MLIKNVFSNANEMIFSNNDFLKLILSSIIRSRTKAIYNRLRLKNRKFVKAKEIMIEIMFNRENKMFLLNFKKF